MGTGNLTELTDCDSVGVNTILMGLVSELSVGAVLVVQVSNHCRNSIRETDRARKLMYYAKKNQRLPIGIDKSLMCLADRKVVRTEKDEIINFKELTRDKNYRIIIGHDGVNLFNANTLKTFTDPYEFYDFLDVQNNQED